MQRRSSANHRPANSSQPSAQTGERLRLPNLAQCTGRVLCNRFLVEELWDETAQGALFRAYHLGTDQQVLLELTLPSEGPSRPLLVPANRQSPASGSRILLPRECAMLRGQWPLFVHPWLEGMSLSRILRRNGPMGARGAIGVAIGLCEALVEARGRGAQLLSMPTDKLWFVPSRPKRDRVLVLGSCFEACPEGRPRQTGVFGKGSRADGVLLQASAEHRESVEVALVLSQLITDSYATGITAPRLARQALVRYSSQRSDPKDIELALVAQLQRSLAEPAASQGGSPQKLADGLRAILRAFEPPRRAIGPATPPVRCVHLPARCRAVGKAEPKVIVQQRKTA